MKRIRLQIQILPWDTVSAANQQARQDDVRPWTQPEDAENTLQKLVENITQRYGRIYVGRGALKVKELQDSWGSTLDLTDTVGDVFDDRSSSGDILTSICKVVRYPPNPAELSNQTRFTSLLPESSARPQKRPPPPLFRDAPRLLPSIEETTDQGRQSAFTQPNKRRKVTREASTRDGNTRAAPLSQEQLQGSQSQGQGSERQVLDSQASPARSKNIIGSVRQPLNMTSDGNSYGTPNSLTNRERTPNTQNTIHVVPDSPNNGRALADRRNRERTKSESPELRVSVHDVAPSQEDINHAQTSPSVACNPPSHESFDRAAQPVASIQPRALAEPVIPAQSNESVGADESSPVPSRPEGSARKTSPLPSNLSGAKESLEKSPARLSDPPALEASARKSPNAFQDRAVAGAIANPEATITRRTKADVFDPIESDSEGFQARQQMFPAKRLTLSKTPDKHGTIVGKNIRTSASKSQLKGPKSNGFLLTTSKGTENRAAVTQRQRTATNESEQNEIARGSSPKSITGRKRVPKASRPESQAQPAPMPIETEVGADVLSQLATSEVNLSDKEDQRTDQSSHPQSSTSKSQNISDNANTRSVDATDHDYEDNGPPEMSHGDDDAGSSALKPSNIRNNVNAEDECQNPDHPSDGATKPLMGPPAIPNAYVEIWKKSNPTKTNSHPEEMANQTLSQERGISTSKDSTAQIPKMTTVNIPRESAIQEKRLAEQAEKMMVAADGARQLQLEQAKLKQGARTPKTNGWTAVNGNTIQQKPMTKKQEADQKRREADQKRRDAQITAAKKFRARSQYVTSSPYEAGKIASANGQGIPSSQLSSSQKIGSEGLSSSASNVDSTSSSKRRTLTPSHPPRTSSDVQQFSSPMSSMSVASSGLPLKSALRQPASNLRRSMSQVAFDESSSKLGLERPVSNVASSSPSFPPPTSNPPDSTLTKAKPAKITPQPAAKAQSKGTVKATTKPTSRKVQSTLKVTRDKEQKGRLSGPPVTKETFLQDKSSISSSSDDEVSSFISDEVVDVGINKAGPSSKQKPSTTKAPQIQKESLAKTRTSSVKSSSPLPEAFSSSIDPALQALKPSASQSSGNTSTRNSQSTHGSSKHAEEPTSGQIGTSDHSSGSESDSDDEPGSTSTKPLHENSLGKSTSHHKGLDSKSSKESSKSSKVRADGMLANGMRPANYKYPSLSQLKREAQGKPHRPRVIHPKASNPIPVIKAVISESGSEEDVSESDSDAGDDGAETHKKKSGFLAGARGLLKLMQSK